MRYNVTRLHNVKSYANSGAGAISSTIHAGSNKIVLLGYDCQHTNGKSHWHGDHPAGLGNAGRTEAWIDEFAKLANDAKHVEIINATRETALKCFKQMDLEAALWQT